MYWCMYVFKFGWFMTAAACLIILLVLRIFLKLSIILLIIDNIIKYMKIVSISKLGRKIRNTFG